MWINNRVNIIRKNLPSEKWFYLPTIENPANIATFISNPLKLVNNLLWWRGPQTLNSDNVQIPNQDVFNIVEKSKSDIYETVKMDNVVEKVVGVGVTCFVRRFILNLKTKVRGENLLEGEWTTLEIENSEVLWLKYEQQFVVNGETFEEIKHSLNLFYDEQSLLRSKTRHCELDKLDINRK